MKITIPGRPVPYVRTTQKAKFVSQSYARYKNYKQYVQLFARKLPCIESYCKVNVIVYLDGKKSPMGNDGDIDNYAKGILDSLNKIAFKDDRFVLEVSAKKIKSSSERVEIEVVGCELDQEMW